MRCRMMLATMLCLTLVGCIMDTEDLHAPPPTESLEQGLREQAPESPQTEVTGSERGVSPVQQAAPDNPADRASVLEHRTRPDPCPWRIDPTSGTVERSNVR
jgi:hypothetical protein